MFIENDFPAELWDNIFKPFDLYNTIKCRIALGLSIYLESNGIAAHIAIIDIV